MGVEFGKYSLVLKDTLVINARDLASIYVWKTYKKWYKSGPARAPALTIYL